MKIDQQELQQRPYRGMQTFTEEHKDLFFGRTKPRDEIFELLKNNLLTVVFGKSGIGKSSLLNAGLVPKLRENFFLPIVIRIPFADLHIDPLAYTRMRIESEIKNYIRKDFRYPGDTTLWQFFREANYTGGAVIPVLIFDQFEEYFSFGKDNAGCFAFIKQLSDLIENRVPDSLPDEARKIISTADTRNIFRVVISLREDFLAPLEDLSVEIPSLNKVRYRILQLHGKEAFEAVYLPAKHLIDEETTKHLLRKIMAPKVISSASREANGHSEQKSDWEQSDFEPYILSLFCFQVNEKRIKSNHEKISGELIDQTKVETILRDYYFECIWKYRRKYRKNFSPILEKNLISDEGYRLLKPGSAKEFKVFSEQVMSDLVDDRIIHRENRNDLSYIEISHDLLAKVIYDRKVAEQNKKRSYRTVGALLLGALMLFIAIYYTRERKNLVVLQKYRDSISVVLDSLKQRDSLVARNTSTIQTLNTTVADLVTGDAAGSDLSGPDSIIKNNAIIYFQVKYLSPANKKSPLQITMCTEALRKLNFQIPDIEDLSGREFKNQIKYFHKEDETNASLIKSICERYYLQPFTIISMINTPLALKAPVGQTEVWVNYEPYFLQLFNPNSTVRKSAAEFMIKNHKTADPENKWIGKMIQTARSNPENKNGIYNILVVFENWENDYLRNDEELILSWLDEIQKKTAADSRTSQLIETVRSKLAERRMPER